MLPAQSERFPKPRIPVPDEAALEEERERFLREFKAQALRSHTRVDGAGSCCSLEENHQGESEPATVVRAAMCACRRGVDLLEASLHMDLKEATRVVYEAVWADPSDPSKTYQNAARAVLAELRKRAGISAVLGPLQPLAH